MQIRKLTMLTILVCCLLIQVWSSQAAHPQADHSSTSSAMASLDRYQWKNRLLLVFASSETSENYRAQMQLLENKQAEMNDRDLLLIHVLGQGDVIGSEINSTSADHLRTQFGVNSAEFCVILVGKDGTEKRREVAPIQPSVVFSQIDTMPMRRQEMGDRSS